MVSVMEIVETARRLLEKYPLCDYCLGRQFAMLGHGLSNWERGKAIKLLLILEGSRLVLEKEDVGKELLRTVATNGFSQLSSATLKFLGAKVEEEKKTCFLCGDAFESLDESAEKVVKMLSGYDFESFLVGVRVETWAEEKEDELRAKYKIKWGESIRSDFSREIGRRIVKATGKDADFKRPEILVTVNPFTKSVSLKVNSLFVYGRYRKLVRGIPQSKWLCGKCGGRGCEGCNWTGKLYPDSVEELISQPLLQATGGSDVKIHAAGREDIDVRVLGSGRPFVIEVLNPVRRRMDLKHVEEEINAASRGKVEVEGLEFTSKDMVRKLKAMEGAKKVYQAIVEFEKEVSDEALSILKERVENTIIRQQTPTRVMHRRAEKLRKKRLFGLEMKRLKPNLVEMFLSCEGGLYIKEFISGDEGRTTPSVTEIVEVPARCIELDVMKVCVEESN